MDRGIRSRIAVAEVYAVPSACHTGRAVLPAAGFSLVEQVFAPYLFIFGLWIFLPIVVLKAPTGREV